MTLTKRVSGASTAVENSKPDNVHQHRVPCAPPPFTLADLRRAIPAHCFQPSIIHSLLYLAMDASAVVILFFLAQHIDSTFTNEAWGAGLGFFIRHVCWCAYWLAQGSVFTGLWILGHECGHGGFAKSSLVNDVFGLVIHSFVLVPFFSWKFSHSRHHSNTGNIDRDEVFIPPTSPSPLPADDEVPFSVLKAIQRVLLILGMFLVGWPCYLLFNSSGNYSYKAGWDVNHFYMYSPIFKPNERWLVLVSDLGLVVMLAFVGYYAWMSSVLTMFYMYGVPYLLVNAHLVLITYLQHTDQAVPHYSTSEWDWLRGALCTVDRDYGLYNILWHHITDTHVVHHLFSYMPFYHAQEATEALKPVLGKYYLCDKTPIWKALWKSYHSCQIAAPDVKSDRPGVLWYHHNFNKK